MQGVTDEQPAVKKGRARGLLIGAAAVLVGLGLGLLIWGGLPGRLDDASAGDEVHPIVQPGGFGDLPVAPEEGALAPDFMLQTADGETFALSDLRGQAVLINFWATWCGPCRLEMPAIQTTYEARQTEGFAVLAVDYTGTDSVPDVVAFGDELGLTFPLLLDSDSEVQDLYRIRAYPSSFFVDEEGVIQTVQFGPMTEEQLNTYVDALLE